MSFYIVKISKYNHPGAIDPEPGIDDQCVILTM